MGVWMHISQENLFYFCLKLGGGGGGGVLL